MALVLDPATVSLTVKRPAGKETFVHVGTARALFHCGSGAINLKAADKESPVDMPKILSHPITWKGEVTFSGDPKNPAHFAELGTKWKFGFFQVSNTMVEEYVYAGRMENEGSMRADKKLGYAPNPSIDSGEEFPFTGSQNDVTITKGFTEKAAFVVRTHDGDHPNFMLPLERVNKAPPATNYLSSARRDEGFTTVFTAIDAAGAKHFLAHFDWHIIWDCRFRWTSGTAVPAKLPLHLSFQIGQVVAGAPTNPAVLAVCNNPARPSSNELDAKTELMIWEERKQPFLMQSKTRSPDIPADFYT